MAGPFSLHQHQTSIYSSPGLPPHGSKWGRTAAATSAPSSQRLQGYQVCTSAALPYAAAAAQTELADVTLLWPHAPFAALLVVHLHPRGRAALHSHHPAAAATITTAEISKRRPRRKLRWVLMPSHVTRSAELPPLILLYVVAGKFLLPFVIISYEYTSI